MPDELATLPTLPFDLGRHRNSQCHLCRLSRENPEAYLWLEAELADGSLTQQQIADELGSRWGIKAKQPQVSNHKTKHVDPALTDYREQMARDLAILSVHGELEPEEHAQVAAQLALMDLRERLGGADAKEAASIASAMARHETVLQRSPKLALELEIMELKAQRERFAVALAQGQMEQELVAYVKAKHPELLADLQAAEQAETAGAQPAGDEQ